jgi:hypothetical protein
MKERTTFTLTPEVRQLIRKLADAEGVSMASIIEMAVRYLAKSQRRPIEDTSEDETSYA